MFVHHPDPKHTGTERVGARTVAFNDGVAEVAIQSVLARYEKAGYAITKTKQRPKAAEVAVVTESPGVELDS